MNPSKIELTSISKLFEYEKISREIENCEDIELLKNICKSYVKLYFAQQECLSTLNINA
jgi:uncharacterized pyridoxamine 5'-phosphate oxidase family protein